MKANHLAREVRLRGQLRRQYLPEADECRGPRVAKENAPGLRQHREDTRLQERALSGAGRTDQREKMKALQLTEHRFELGLASEKELGLIRAEREETGVGLLVLGNDRADEDLVESTR